MRNVKGFIGRAVILVLVVAGIGMAQEKMSVTSSSSKDDCIVPTLDLSSLSPDVTYSFSASSDSPLMIKPVDASGVHPEPFQMQSDGYDGGGKDVSTQSSIHHAYLNPAGNKACEPMAASIASVRYSGMFMTGYYEGYWAFEHNHDDFINLLNTMSNDEGMRIESIDIYPNATNTESRYGGTWLDDDKGWAWALSYSSNDFVDLLNSYGTAGKRITDIEFDIRSRLYGGVWIEDGKGWAWGLNFSESDFLQQLQIQKDANRRPVDFRIYPNLVGTDFLYAGVWVDNSSDNYAWRWVVGYNWTDFQILLNEQNADSKRLIDYEVYKTASGARYAGCWVNDGENSAYALNFDDRNAFVTQINTFQNDYTLRPVSFEMYTDISSAVEDEPVVIRDFELSQNYPNPFNPSTALTFALPEPAFVTLKVYDLLGNEVVTLVEENRPSGRYEVTFHTEDLPSGIYLCRLEANGNSSFVQTRKMNLIK